MTILKLSTFSDANKNTGEDIDMSKDYPCDRLLQEIFGLFLEMRDAGLACEMSFYQNSFEQQHLSINVWTEKNERNCYGKAENEEEIEAVISSYYSLGGIGNCVFDHDDFECLHKLYDAMFEVYRAKKMALEVNF
jgi:hypothetical protein